MIVLSHGAWQRRFGGDRGVVGQKVTIDGEPYEVVGVMASGFDFPEETDGWIPLVAHPRAGRGNHMLRAIGRLAPGQTLASAQAEARGGGRGAREGISGQQRRLERAPRRRSRTG